MADPDPAHGLPGRIGVIGGIESLVLDDRRLWFGFDFTSDQVLSPLIGDAGAMARYAARHMRQRTGAHNEDYWTHLVRAAVENSDLVQFDEQRTFTTRSLEAGDASPAHGHLLYLLDAAAEDPDDEDGELRPVQARTTVGNWSLLFAPYVRSAQTA
ncbi:hypothetical protein ACF08M_06930 [Streptomyces sp. NPDC015032]|uniref:hypothetical protein n=1 Tax=Streptomyces sp. NPDC015032 TaxID=3364937 RepID=UPI0037020FA7